MKILSRKAAFEVIVTLAVLLPVSAVAEVPEWVAASDNDSAPLWVSAKAASSGGRLRPELFPEATRQHIEQSIDRIRKYRASTGDDGLRTVSGNSCALWSIVSRPALPQDVSLAWLFENSAQVYSGTITDLDQGFVDGFPGMLLELAVDKPFKAQQERTPHQLYVHFQHAELLVDGEFLCAKSDRYPDLPAVGQRILVFQRDLAATPVIHAHKVEILYAHPDGTVSSPQALKWEVSSIEKVEDLLTAMSLEAGP